MKNYKQHLFSLSNWLIIVLIVWLWLSFALNGNNELEHNNQASKTTSLTTFVNHDSIEKYHIFGSAQQLYETPLSNGNTTLNLVLNGTMSSSDAQAGLAYISNNQGTQQKFREGDKVFELATLKEIYKTYVVLNYNGKNERLSISENSTNPVIRKKPQSNNKPSTYLKHLNGNQQSNWQEMLDTQKFDPNKISSIVGNVNLVTDQAGQIQGLRLSNLADGNLLVKHGLKSNDIITAINGNNVSAKNMLSIRETLQQDPNATVTIKRNGKVQNIQINIGNL